MIPLSKVESANVENRVEPNLLLRRRRLKEPASRD